MSVLNGCDAGQPRQASPSEAARDVVLSRADLVKLDDDLDTYMRLVEDVVERAAERMQARATTRAVRRAVLLWKLELVTEMNEDRIAKAPIPMLMDTWALWVRFHDFAQSARGEEAFGDVQPEAVKASQEVLRATEQLVRDYLSEDERQTVLRKIQAYGRANPIEGVTAGLRSADFTNAESGQNALAELFGTPFRAVEQVGRGLDPTASLARSMDYFTDLMADLPTLIRWQAELLLEEFEDLQAVRGTVASLERTSKAFETLPSRIRQELEKLLGDTTEQQKELQTTLTELERVVNSTNDALGQADQLTQRIGATSDKLVTLGETWQQTAGAVESTIARIQQFQTPDDEGSAAPAQAQPGSEDDSDASFDPNEWTKTAKALQGAAAELRALLDDFERFSEGGAVERGRAEANAIATDVLAESETKARGVVDHIFYRVLQTLGILAIIGAAFFGLRWLAGRH